MQEREGAREVITETFTVQIEIVSLAVELHTTTQMIISLLFADSVVQPEE